MSQRNHRSRGYQTGRMVKHLPMSPRPDPPPPVQLPGFPWLGELDFEFWGSKTTPAPEKWAPPQGRNGPLSSHLVLILSHNEVWRQRCGRHVVMSMGSKMVLIPQTALSFFVKFGAGVPSGHSQRFCGGSVQWSPLSRGAIRAKCGC